MYTGFTWKVDAQCLLPSSLLCKAFSCDLRLVKMLRNPMFHHHFVSPAGARWDTQTGVICEARLKELTPAMPVISVRAVPDDRQETRNIYECPLYKTKIRGPTYVWTLSLKTRERPAKWVLAGVALLLSV